jgi:hypothetical protein
MITRFKCEMVSMVLRDSMLESIAPNVNAPLKEYGSCTYCLGVRGKGSCVGGHSECGAWDEQLPHRCRHMLRMSPLVFFPLTILYVSFDKCSWGKKNC